MYDKLCLQQMIVFASFASNVKSPVGASWYAVFSACRDDFICLYEEFLTDKDNRTRG